MAAAEPGLQGDLDQFVVWVHHIATHGLGSLYGDIDAGRVSFGPVMAYVWAVLAAIQPAFATVTDSSDPAIRSLMKLPASLADSGSRRSSPTRCGSGRAGRSIGSRRVLLHPAVIDVSAWWGQYESIYVLIGLGGARVRAQRPERAGRGALLAVSLMTKPQALPFLVPFAAWFWATGGIREVARAAVIGLGVIAVLWLPFLAAGGPIGYLDNCPVLLERRLRRSCRYGRGTRGGCSRRRLPAGTSSATTWRSWGRSRCATSAMS